MNTADHSGNLPGAGPEGAALHAALIALHAATMAIVQRNHSAELHAECQALGQMVAGMQSESQPIGADLAVRLLRMSDLVRRCAQARPDPDIPALRAFQAALARAVAENNALIAARRAR